MPATIRVGSAGLDVKVLQIQLNLAYPRKKALVVDGLFGPMTRSAVIEFQRDRKLAVDAIVGPVTWAALGKVRGQRPRSNGDAPCCSPYHDGNATMVTQAVQKILAGRETAASPLAATKPFVLASSVEIGGMTVTQLLGSTWESDARAVYGSSLFYDRIFLSSALLPSRRAFAFAMRIPVAAGGGLIPSLPVGGWIQVLLVGRQPGLGRVIHELGHAWQSQHHPDARAYLVNCLACQAAAVALNEAIGVIDSDVKSHDDWPVHFPMSAYAYIPGRPFATYGGEQIARQIEWGEQDIIDHVKAMPPGLSDPSNFLSLRPVNICVEDCRAPDVKS